VHEAVLRWAEEVLRQRNDILRLGYLGSYARGDWGVGSDLDLIIIVEDSPEPFARRATHWDVTALPVPTDLLVYTAEEWSSLNPQGRFYSTLIKEAIWVFIRDENLKSSDRD
jgi:hypothetical protein